MRYFSRKKSIYIDTYTGLYGAASEMESAPAYRKHRYKFVGLHKHKPSINGVIIKKFLRENNLEHITLKHPPTKLKRKQVIEQSNENYF